jgi:GR25 family glycosyltransferase involved in LPS biosynthesis
MKHLIDNNINEALILEDDIELSADITEILYRQPKDSLISFLDTTHIENMGGFHNPTWVNENWLLLDKYSGIRCWCAACYFVADIKKVYYNLIVNAPKLYDKCLIDYIQKDFKTYLYFPAIRIAKQNRTEFESSIK